MSKQRLMKEKQTHKPSAEVKSTGEQRQRLATDPYTDVLSLQSLIGNRAVNRLIESNRMPSSKLPISQPNEAVEQEAEQIADKVVKHPAQQAVTSRIPRIQRHPSALDGSQHVDPSNVDRVLSGAGSPLQLSVQQDMEMRFGRDFSNVRLHTNEDAARSADAVNAQAYTVGNHIVFGPHKLAPETEAGSRLLAHELVHVVQQTGGGSNGRRVLSRQLKVGLEGWGSNLIGDDDSQVTFTPTAEFETREYSRDLAATSTYGEVFEVIKSGVASGQYARTDLDVPIAGGRSGVSGTIPIKAGMKGVVTINVRANFEMDEKWNDDYEHTLACSWEVEAGTDGKLKISAPMIGNDAIGNNEAPFQLSGLNPAQDGEMGFAQISPQYTSYQFTDVPNVQIGGGLEGGGKGVQRGVQGGITLGNETTYPAGMLVRTFKLNFQVTDIPEPKGEVTLGPLSMLKKWNVKFPPPRRGKGQSAVSSPEEQSLIAFYKSLSVTTKEQLITGATPIALIGKASTTGDPAMNRDLSNMRMENVKTILSQFVGNKAVFEYRSIGEYEAKTENDIESDEERVVTVEIWDQVTAGEQSGNIGP